MTSLTDVSSNGTDLDAGQTVTFTLVANEALTIGAGAALKLSNGATAVYNSSTGTFVYTVAAGQDTADLTVSGYSGSITDAAGNALVASSVTLDTGVKIDTVAPTAAITSPGTTTNQSSPTISGTVDVGDARSRSTTIMGRRQLRARRFSPTAPGARPSRWCPGPTCSPRR